MNQIPLIEKDKAMEDYSVAMTFYAPIPDKEDLQKEFLAKAGSWAGTQILNAIIMQVGITIPITFEFKYEYGDETWKTYPEGYFMKNFGLTPDEYKKMVHNSNGQEFQNSEAGKFKRSDSEQPSNAVQKKGRLFKSQ